MGLLIGLLKRMAISLVFDYVWEQLVAWLREEVKKTDNKYDDGLVAWFDGKKGEVQQTVKAVVKK